MSTSCPPQPASIGSLDALFQCAEATATDTHVGSCAVFAGPAPALGELTPIVHSTMARVERFRQWARFVPGEAPIWFETPDLRMADHLHAVSVPPAGNDGEDRALEALMTRLMAGELPHGRPLWAMWLVDGLRDGRWAIVSKVHPCMVDGVAGVDLLQTLLGATGLWSFSRILAPFTAHPPADAWNQATAEGSWAVARCSLDDIEAVGATVGVGVNDVIGAVVAAAFGDVLTHGGTSSSGTRFCALVPVPRGDRNERVLENRVPMMITELPVHIADPIDRLHSFRTSTRRLDDAYDHGAEPLGPHVVDVLPASLFGWLEQAAKTQQWIPQRTVSTVITNVSERHQPFSLLGRQLLEYVPFVPIGEGLRLGVAVVTSGGLCTFGITGDGVSAVDASFFAARVEAAVQELIDLVKDRDADNHHRR